MKSKTKTKRNQYLIILIAIFSYLFFSKFIFQKWDIIKEFIVSLF